MPAQVKGFTVLKEFVWQKRRPPNLLREQRGSQEGLAINPTKSSEPEVSLHRLNADNLTARPIQLLQLVGQLIIRNEHFHRAPTDGRRSP